MATRSTQDHETHWRRRPLIKGMLYPAAATLGLFVVVWWAFMYAVQERMIYPAHVTPEPDRAPRFEGVRVLQNPIGAGEHAEAWFIPPPGHQPGAPMPLVVFFHGNAELIDHQDMIVQGYRRLGFGLLLPEYRGYGRSGGRPGQEVIRTDTLLFLDQLGEQVNLDEDRLVYHGRSLGGGVAIDVASARGPSALIIESSFRSVASLALRFGVPSFLVRHPYESENTLGANAWPVLLFHGKRDRIIPPEHGAALHQAARGSTLIHFDCGHNDFPGLANGTAYWGHIEEFLEGLDIVN